MTVVSIFHNPRCSKSREALALLQAQGLTPEVIDYLKTPPSLADLQALLTLLDVPARELLRTGEDEYQALGLGDMGLSAQDLLRAIASHPQLLQRPIVVNGARAVIARPPARLLALL
jgi:arsenate reductase (glutaredoxin)